MSEQIREQVSAFLDGELPNSETELLLKRLTRDAELRESFGRYALIGEAMRGASQGADLTRGFAARVNRRHRRRTGDGGPAGGTGSRQPLVAAFRGRCGRGGRRGGRGGRDCSSVPSTPALRAALPVTAQNAVAVKPQGSHLLYGARRHARGSRPHCRLRA